MELQNKYYTPEIEEFHVGFEYEMWETHSKLYDRTIDDSKWVKKKHDTKSISLDKLSCRLKDCRVKYLDQSDIESLGWIYNETNKNGNLYIKEIGNTKIALYHKEKSLNIYFVTTSKYLIESGGYFQGTIRNKSELKKLMQQLNIK